MGEDQHEKLSRKERRKRERLALGPLAEEVLSPRGNGHKKVIEALANNVAAAPATSDSNPAAAHTAPKPKGRIAMANDGTAQAGEKTRRQNLTYTYRDKEGVVQEKFSADSRSVIMTVDSIGKSVEFAVSDLISDQEVINWLADNAPTALMSMLFGMKTTSGNSVTSVKNGSGEEMLEAIEQRKETLVDKDWREGGERGPSPKLVLEAMIAWYTNMKGRAPDEAKVAVFKSTIKEQGSKQVLTDGDIAAEFEAVKLREQQKKVDAARAAAKSGAGSLSALLD